MLNNKPYPTYIIIKLYSNKSGTYNNTHKFKPIQY